MTKNPTINALLAVLYIVLISTVMFSGTMFNIGEDSVLAPITLLSLLSFSVLAMAFIFAYKPVTLFIDGDGKLGLKILLRSFVIFGLITLIFLVTVFTIAINRKV